MTNNYAPGPANDSANDSPSSTHHLQRRRPVRRRLGLSSSLAPDLAAEVSHLVLDNAALSAGQSAITARKTALVAKLLHAGLTHAQVADLLKLSRQRVSQYAEKVRSASATIGVPDRDQGAIGSIRSRGDVGC